MFATEDTEITERRIGSEEREHAGSWPLTVRAGDARRMAGDQRLRERWRAGAIRRRMALPGVGIGMGNCRMVNSVMPSGTLMWKVMPPM